jgi:ribosomal protein S18 acetylase RimI-like enzyme
MTEAARDRPEGVEVVRVDDSRWEQYRDIRLAMLRGAPRAFWTTYEQAAERTDEEWRALVASSDVWLALLEGRAVGSVGLFQLPEAPDDEGILVGMWVDPAARGLGVGERLVGAVVEAAVARGWRRLLLEVAHENTPAIALYERTGFVPTGHTGAMPHDPSITEFEMELLLG